MPRILQTDLIHLRLVISTLLALGASPCIAQTRVASLEELRRQLSAGDVVTVVPAAGQPITGRLTRIGDDDLFIRLVDTRHKPQDRGRAFTVPFNAIRSLERPRDSVRNGIVIGAGIGAGVSGAMFVNALIVDRNEVDEWAGPYAAAAAFFTGIGALIGWAVDAVRSKPHIIFDASPGRMTVSVQPLSRRAGIALAVSFSP